MLELEDSHHPTDEDGFPNDPPVEWYHCVDCDSTGSYRFEDGRPDETTGCVVAGGCPDHGEV